MEHLWQISFKLLQLYKHVLTEETLFLASLGDRARYAMSDSLDLMSLADLAMGLNIEAEEGG